MYFKQLVLIIQSRSHNEEFMDKCVAMRFCYHVTAKNSTSDCCQIIGLFLQNRQRSADLDIQQIGRPEIRDFVRHQILVRHWFLTMLYQPAGVSDRKHLLYPEPPIDSTTSERR